MKYNRAISLSFLQNQSSSSTSINIPIQIKRILCKAVGYVGDDQPAVGAAEYGFIISDLTQNQPIGMFYDDSTYPNSMGANIEYVFENPQTIQGVFTFTLTELDLSPYSVFPVGGANLGLILEFDTE